MKSLACACLILAFSAGGLITGCAQIDAMQEAERGGRLRDALRTYGKLVRWGEFAQASRYIRSEEEPPEPARRQSAQVLDSVNVTHYRLTQIVFDEEQSHAQVTHELRFFHEDTRRELTVPDRQIWWWNDESSSWFLDGGIPDFEGALRRPRER